MNKPTPLSATASVMYNPQTIEIKWQKYWAEHKLFQSSQLQNVSNEDKMYLLFAFAYPSGSGLHVGHVESKTALDIMARFYRMQGKQVFFPVGWDAFGLPAENYAVKTGVHPAITTKNAINTFRTQIQRIGISYDWDNEIATSHPEYYKWTQWLFLQLFQAGLAYRKKGDVNWCPSCQTVLANEQVVNGECERCGTKVIQKELEQWFFKITEYQDELISGLDKVDWPEPTKQHQLHWIGKKQGINIEYQIKGSSQKIVCFTTRPDTNFGATFIVIAPEHELAQEISQGKTKIKGVTDSISQEVKEYLHTTKAKTELDRQTEGKKKTGVCTGLYAINNLNGKELPIYISDFVLGGFGTGAVVGVPAHDVRDFQFAQVMQLSIVRVVVGADNDTSRVEREEQVQEEAGMMINSDFLNGLDIHQATVKVMDHLEEKGWGKRVVTYKLRDWLISRQRYWGAPIPIVYDPEGKPHPVKKEHLPWTLPTDVEFRPTGKSPLTYSKEFIERTEKLYGKGWRPEFDTMDTFVDSSWYYLRYADSRNQEEFANPEQLKKWLPVDMYMIGPEHIVLHLLYSRFFTKFLRDQGYITFDEPFKKMRHQGMILGPDGKKMSKSKGNVINPDEVIEKFGADTLRIYEMFMGPLESDKPWSTTAVAGVYRFLSRVNSLAQAAIAGAPPDDIQAIPTALKRKLYQTIHKVSDDIPKLKFNTAIASMMELLNVWEDTNRASKTASLTQPDIESFIKLISPFAPFLAEELWHSVHGSKAKSVHLQSWPSVDPSLLVEESLKVAVQVNGKLREVLDLSPEDAQSQVTVLSLALDSPKVSKWLGKTEPKKVVFVPKKLLNIVM